MRIRNYLILLALVGLAITLLWLAMDSEEDVVPVLEAESIEVPALLSEPTGAEPETVDIIPAHENLFEALIEQPEPEIVLPELNSSDTFVRENMRLLDAASQWADWMERDELVRRFAVIVENASRGDLPRRQLEFLAPEGRFKVRKLPGEIYLNTQNYTRYDGFVDVLMRLPIEPTARFLVTLEPLLAPAFQELGIAETDAGSLLGMAIDQALKTPIVHGEIKLEQPKVLYKYLDPGLERLRPLQKQLLRMGPSNTLRIQTFLRRLKLALEGDML